MKYGDAGAALPMFESAFKITQGQRALNDCHQQERRKHMDDQIEDVVAGRVELANRPEVLWDHPELERLWGKLTDEYDLGSRVRAIGQKLEVIRMLRAKGKNQQAEDLKAIWQIK